METTQNTHNTDLAVVENSRRYSVNSFPTSSSTFVTHLIIKNVTEMDGNFMYQCACNVYKEDCQVAEEAEGSRLVAEASFR